MLNVTVEQKITAPKSWDFSSNSSYFVGEQCWSLTSLVVNSGHDRSVFNLFVKVVECLPFGGTSELQKCRQDQGAKKNINHHDAYVCEVTCSQIYETEMIRKNQK